MTIVYSCETCKAELIKEYINGKIRFSFWINGIIRGHCHYEMEVKHCNVCNKCCVDSEHCGLCNMCVYNRKHHCDICNKCVSPNFKHCNICKKCDINYTHCSNCKRHHCDRFIYCEKCNKCIPKEYYSHCDKCNKCKVYPHRCNE